jgi:hypothetical protein
MAITWIRRAVLALAVGLAAGCGGDNKPVPPRTDDELLEVWGMYHDSAAAARKPPAALRDVERFEPQYLNGYSAVFDGRVHVAWSTPLTGTPADANRVLAYQAEVPEKGGRVLMADGTLRTMSAAAYASAVGPTPPR